MLINEENFHEIIHRSFPCFRTPTGLEDVSKYPELFAELLARGWSERDIQKLAGLNLIRVFKAVEKVNFFFQDRVVKRKEKKREDKRFLPLSWREKKMRNSAGTSPRSSLARNNRWSETGLAESTDIGFNKAHKSCIRLCIVERDGWTRPRFLFFWSPANPRTSCPQKPAFLFP